MKLSDIKWWHYTLAVIVIAAAVRVATGGPLPFLAPAPQSAQGKAAASGRPAREPNTGPSMVDVVQAGGLKIGSVVPELHRLTVEVQIPNPGTPVGLADGSGVAVREIAQALQKGVSEDNSDISLVRVLVATKGEDRTGKMVAHLSLYALDYRASDLFVLKPTATAAQVLALTQKVVFNSAQSHDALRDWCKAGDNLNQATAFCGLVTASKGV